ncbi:hypothetical protein K439DRAFT_1612124 [Ramaria rubella]|nr:hypothetical protein K439DRAFT_1612124 [Ramaria rubella]
MFEIGHALDATKIFKKNKCDVIKKWCEDNPGEATEDRIKWWWCKEDNIAMICAGVLALYEKTSRGGGDIFKSKIEDLRTLALLLKSPQSQIAEYLPSVLYSGKGRSEEIEDINPQNSSFILPPSMVRN